MFHIYLQDQSSLLLPKIVSFRCESSLLLFETKDFKLVSFCWSIKYFVVCWIGEKNHTSGNSKTLLFVNMETVFNKFLLSIHVFLSRIASSILMNWYQWGSYLPWKIPTKEPMKLAMISDSHHQRSHRESNSDLNKGENSPDWAEKCFQLCILGSCMVINRNINLRP